MARICWGRSASCFSYSFVIQVIIGKTLCSKGFANSLRYIYNRKNTFMQSYTAWKVSIYRVFTGPYFPTFGHISRSDKFDVLVKMTLVTYLSKYHVFYQYSIVWNYNASYMHWLYSLQYSFILRVFNKKLSLTLL